MALDHFATGCGSEVGTAQARPTTSLGGARFWAAGAATCISFHIRSVSPLISNSPIGVTLGRRRRYAGAPNRLSYQTLLPDMKPLLKVQQNCTAPFRILPCHLPRRASFYISPREPQHARGGYLAEKAGRRCPQRR